MEQPLSQLSAKPIGDFLIRKAGVPTAYKSASGICCGPVHALSRSKKKKSKAPHDRSAQNANCPILIN